MPEMSLTVRVSEIGIVRVSVGYSEPFATFSGRENTIFGGMTRWALATYLHICLYGPPRDRPYATSVHALTILNLVDAIASEGHGGALLFVDEENGTWEKAIDPFPYRFAEPDTTIPTTLSDEFLLLSARYVAETVMRASDDVSDELVRLILKRLTSSVWEESECVRRSARFAAADGAIVMTKALKIVGFGAKISAEAVVPSVCFYRPDTEAHERISLERCGGTRHQSAVRFVNAVRDAVALVISQDRHVSLLHWSEKLDAVAIVSNAQWMM